MILHGRTDNMNYICQMSLVCPCAMEPENHFEVKMRYLYSMCRVHVESKSINLLPPKVGQSG